MRLVSLSIFAALGAIVVGGCSLSLAPKQVITPPAIPADWQTLNSADGAASIRLPSDWKAEPLSTLSKSTQIIKTGCPSKVSPPYSINVIVAVSQNHVTTPIRQATFDGFVREATTSAPDMSTLKSAVVQLPCGDGFFLEQNRMLNSGGTKVPFHQFLYDIPHGDSNYIVVISGPPGDKAVDDSQLGIICSLILH